MRCQDRHASSPTGRLMKKASAMKCCTRNRPPADPPSSTSRRRRRADLASEPAPARWIGPHHRHHRQRQQARRHPAPCNPRARISSVHVAAQARTAPNPAGRGRPSRQQQRLAACACRPRQLAAVGRPRWTRSGRPKTPTTSAPRRAGRARSTGKAVETMVWSRAASTSINISIANESSSGRKFGGRRRRGATVVRACGFMARSVGLASKCLYSALFGTSYIAADEIIGSQPSDGTRRPAQHRQRERSGRDACT